jgi:hypothetical protein
MVAVFDRAVSLGTLADPAELYVCRAGIEIRAKSPATISTFATGLESCLDPYFKLEKLLLDWVRGSLWFHSHSSQAETSAPNMLSTALMLLDKPSKARSSSYQMILLRSGVET